MAIKKMYMNIKKCVKVECVISELFDIKVGICQGFVLSSLLITVIEEVTKDMEDVLRSFFMQMTWHYSRVVARKWDL